MKLIIFFLTFTLLFGQTSAQSYKVKFGDEIKLKKGTSDLEIISADKSGLYFSESRIKMTSYFVVGATYGVSQQLIKFDKNYIEIFRKEYKKELKGLQFNSFQSLGNDIFIFATDYVKKERQFKVYGARIDKSTGDLQEAFAELGSFDLESSKDSYEMRLKPVLNGKNFLLVADVSSKDHLTLAVSLLNNVLAKSSSAIISLPYSPTEYTLEDVVFSGNNKIIVLGRQYEQVDVAKSKKKKNVFKQYQMTVYNAKGQKESNVNLNAGDRYVIGGKMIEQKEGGILLAGFYSNSAKKEGMDGFFISKVDEVKGELQLASYKDLSAQMMGKSYIQDTVANDSKIAKDKIEAEELSSQYVVRAIDVNPADSSVVITSEVSIKRSYQYTYSSYMNGSFSNTSYYGYEFANRDILVISSSKDGKIKWTNTIPKAQSESMETRDIHSSSNSRAGLIDFFAEGGGMPFYSSFKSLVVNNKLVLIFNDAENNAGAVKYGDKVASVSKFGKSITYGLSMDLSTGEIKRKKINSNDDETVLAPRHAYVMNNEMIIPSLNMHVFGKTALKFATVTVLP
jgi:hypothetical protein